MGLLCLALIPLTAVARVILSTPDIGCVARLLKTAIASIPRTNTLCTICPPSYSLSSPSILSLSTPALVSLAFSALEPVHIVHGSLCLECTSSWLSLTHAFTFLRPLLRGYLPCKALCEHPILKLPATHQPLPHSQFSMSCITVLPQLLLLLKNSFTEG